MRAVRVRITDALHDGEIAGVVKIFEPAHRAVKADVVVDFDNFVGGQPDARARLVIKII